MAVLVLKVEKKRRKVPSLYFLTPSQQFSLFEETCAQILNSLDKRRITNRALIELTDRKGRKKLRILGKKFKRLDGASLKKRKAVYNAFYRIFQRLQWALDSGSEREIELKVWFTSSLDYLCEFIEVLEGMDD